MAEFNILDHIEKLKPDGGKPRSNGDETYVCPACEGHNFLVNPESGRYYCVNGCTTRQVRDAIEPPINPNGSAPSSPRPIPRTKQVTKPPAPESQRPAAITAPINLARLTTPCPQPLPSLPDKQQLDYSPTQRVVVRVSPNGKKAHHPHHLAAHGFALGSGDAPWPSWRQAEAIEHGVGRWIAEAEGEKCCDWLRAGGLVAISQPGHDHTAASIERRYQALADAGIQGIAYLADNDATGRTKAQRCAAAAAAARLAFVVVHASHIWEGIGAGGSIDDGDGTPHQRADAFALAAGTEAVRRIDVSQCSYTPLLDLIIHAIRSEDTDTEMLAKAEAKNRFRVNDDRINADLFKRYSEGRIKRVRPARDHVDMSQVEILQYRMDGFVLLGDIGLLYGPYGTGKTTLALAKAYAGAKGQNILDRSSPCEPFKTLIIATDSGLGPLNKSFDDLGIDVKNDPICIADHPDQKIFVWGHAADQGHAAWVCDIHGIIRLEEFIKRHDIGYVIIDSAKSVSSAAGWSYTSNEAVKALLKYLKEAVAEPCQCFIEFLSHDGSKEGSHSGAKAWAEDPSMVCSLTVIPAAEGQPRAVKAEFKKDRGAPSGAAGRSVTYHLSDGQLIAHRETEVVGTCADAIIAILSDAARNGTDRLSTAAVFDEAFARFKVPRKTVENTLPKLMAGKAPRVVKPRRGFYALSPAELQRLAHSSSSLYRGVGEMGGVYSKPPAAQAIYPPPNQTPTPKCGGLYATPSNPHQPPMGEASGGTQNPAAAGDLPQPPPSNT